MAGILCIQIHSESENKELNKKKIESQLEQNSAKNLDLVLFPEFFATNIDYTKAPEEEDGGETIKWACQLAKKYNTNIVAGTVVRKSGEKFFNTSFAINRDGEVLAKYDKIHLYNFLGGNEGAFTTQGKDIVTVDFDFARVGMAICFDIRYPLHFNKLIKKNVDIIVLPTAWIIPEDVYKYNLDYAKDMWISMLRTRAYDNMVYLAVCNQTGPASNTLYAIGTSMIISPAAEVLAKMDNEEGSIYSEIEMANVEAMRQIYPIAKID